MTTQRTYSAIALSLIFSVFVVVPVDDAIAQTIQVSSHQKISDTEGGFAGILDDEDLFGYSVASFGDLDGAGPSVQTLAVGTTDDDDGGMNRGAVWILFLDAEGTVASHQKISSTEGGFAGILDDNDYFGVSLACLGDPNGAGEGDLTVAVGAHCDDDGGFNRGAVWMLFLNADGTVASYQKISDTEGGFSGILDDIDCFGIGVASLGDLDGPGGSAHTLAIGAFRDDDGGTDRGAVWILFLNADGTVASHQKISDTEGDFTGILDDSNLFGYSVAALGDLDGEGGSAHTLAVGAPGDNDGGAARGAVWILSLNADGTVASHQKISDTEGGFAGILDDADQFGTSVASLGDLDGEGGSAHTLAVGAPRDDDGGTDRGAIWVLFLNTEGTVESHQRISDTEGGFAGTLDDYDYFGWSVASLGDLEGPLESDHTLCAGAPTDDDGGTDRGAVWNLFLDIVPPPPAVSFLSVDCAGDQLVRIESTTGEVTAIGPLGIDLQRVCVALLGKQLYALDRDTPVLHEIDVLSGAVISSVNVTTPGAFTLAEGIAGFDYQLAVSFKGLPQCSGGIYVSNAIGDLALDGTISNVDQFGTSCSNLDLDWLAYDLSGTLYGGDLEGGSGGITILYEVDRSVPTVTEIITYSRPMVNAMCFDKYTGTAYANDAITREILVLASDFSIESSVSYPEQFWLWGLVQEPDPAASGEPPTASIPMRGRVYPNPSGGSVSLSLQNVPAGSYRLVVLDVRGRLVRKLREGPLDGSSTWIWDGRDALGHEVPSGAYLLNLTEANGRNHLSRKMILLGR